MLNEEKLVRFDYAIKYMLRDKANFDILEGFLSALLKDEISVLEILESESNQEAEKLKFNRVDILVKDSSGQRIIVEVQNLRELDYLQRLLWGASKVVVENLELGKPFKEVVKVISVSIMYFNLGRGDDYVYRGKTEFAGTHTGNPLVIKERIKIQETGVVTYPEKTNIFPEYYLINVNKFNDIITEDLDEWIYIFKNSNTLESFKSKNIKSAEEKLKVFKMSKDERKGYEKYLLNLVSETDVINTAKEEAKEEGRKEGQEEGRKEGELIAMMKVAKSLKDTGMMIEVIQAATGLSIEEIERL